MYQHMMDSACCRGTSWYHRTFPHGTCVQPRCKFKTYSRDDAITLQRKISILCLFQFTSFNAKFSVFPSKVTFYAEDGILLLNHQDLSTRLIHLIPPAMAARSKNLKVCFPVVLCWSHKWVLRRHNVMQTCGFSNRTTSCDSLSQTR